MLEFGWVRVLFCGLLLSAWNIVDGLARLGSRAPRRPPPARWMRFVGFAATTYLFIVVGRESGLPGGSWTRSAGLLLAGLALMLRVATRHGARGIRYPDDAARLLYDLAVPLAVGTPRAWLVWTLPAIVIAVARARREDELAVRSGDATKIHRLALTRRWIPGVW